MSFVRPADRGRTHATESDRRREAEREAGQCARSRARSVHTYLIPGQFAHTCSRCSAARHLALASSAYYAWGVARAEHVRSTIYQGCHTA